jgi:arylsulfatase A-like enzyme
VIVVSVDSLRTSRLGVYGYARPTTPSLDRFARTAFRFTRAYSTTSWTKPAMVSLFLGRPVHDHLVFLSLRRVGEALVGMDDLGWETEKRDAAVGRAMVIPDRLEPFHAHLAGFTRAAFVNNPHLSREFGFDRSWEAYRLYPPKNAHVEGSESRAGQMNGDVLRFVDAHPGDDLYLWLHYNDVHYPYGPVRGQHRLFRGEHRRADFQHHSRSRHFSYVQEGDGGDAGTRRLLSDLYDAGLRTFDARLGELFEALRQRGLFDGAFIVVTADHGEEFWEHGSFGHGRNLFGTTSTIPFLVKLPHQDGGRVIDEPVSLIDVGPTVLDISDSMPPTPLPGRSLLPVVRDGQRLERPLLMELVRDGYEVALIRGGWKLRHLYAQATLVGHLEGDPAAPLEPAIVELYDLGDDPDERHPLDLEVNAGRVARMETDLRAALGGRLNIYSKLEDEWESGADVSYPILLGRQDDPRYRRIEDQLRALGYIE